jgi:hypothetical protein
MVHGKKSEKLSEDDRQLAFEDLEIAVAEVEEQKQDQSPGDDKPRRKRVAKRRFTLINVLSRRALNPPTSLAQTNARPCWKLVIQRNFPAFRPARSY